MKETRELWVRETLRLEGGETYTNRAEDRGGPTKFGITHRALAHARRVERVEPQEVAQLEQEEAEAIYRADYWNAVRGDQLPAGIDFYVADMAVLHGVKPAARMLQEVVGAKADGFIGEKTVAAARAKRPLDVLLQLHAKRLLLMVRIPGEANDGGWVNRVSEVLAIAEARLQPRPMLAEALGSNIVRANVAAGGVSTAGLAWVIGEYGPLVLEWLRQPENLDRLQDGARYVAAADLPTIVLVLGAGLALSLTINGYTLWQRIGMWRQGAN